MSGNKILDTMWDDNPIDITQEAILYGQLQINCVDHICRTNMAML